MSKPVHPGEELRTGHFVAAGLSIADFAKAIGVSRAAISALLKSNAPVTERIAAKLAASLGGTTQSWLAKQAAFDNERKSR